MNKTADRNKRLANEVFEDFKKRAEARRGMESVWLLNINFYMGNQYAEIAPDGDVEDFGKQFYWQQREVYNHIAPIIESRLSKFSRIDSSITVRPLTSDDADIKNAKFATKLLYAVNDDLNMKALMNKANFYSELMGTAFYKVVWNKDKGRTVAFRDENAVRDGDVEISVCPPYEIYPDNMSATGISDCRSIMHVKAYPVEEVERVWGVKPEGRDVSVLNADSVTGGGKFYTGRGTRVCTDVKSNHALVIERYERPSKQYPNGRLLIAAEDKLLYEGDLPYRNGINGERTFPFVRQAAFEHPSSFFGASVIERLIPVQRAFNAVKNRKHEFLNRIAMGVLAVEDGSVNLDALEDEGLAPGRILVYRQGSTPPMMMQYGNVPNSFAVEENNLLEEFVTISGISDFMTTSDLSNVNLSGTALSLLIEQDENRLSITSTEIRDALKEVARQVLRLYRQYATMPRMIRVSGDNAATETVAFTSANLTSDDLVFDNAASLSESLASRQNMVMEMLKLGLLYDENGKLSETAKNRALTVLGFGAWENARGDDDMHVRRAAEENERMLKETVEVSEVDRHELHIGEHTRAVVSAEYSPDEAATERIIEHIRRHKIMQKLDAESRAEQQN